MTEIRAVRAKFGNNVKAVLREKNMKQKELARAIKMHEVTLSAYLCGRNSLTLQTCYEISSALEVKLMDLVADIEVATPIVASEEQRPLIFEESLIQPNISESEKHRYERYKKFCEYEELFSKAS